MDAAIATLGPGIAYAAKSLLPTDIDQRIKQALSNPVGTANAVGVQASPANIMDNWHYTEKITSPFIPEPVQYDNAERTENAWDRALVRELTPGCGSAVTGINNEGARGKFWLFHNTDYLNLFVESYSSKSLKPKHSVFCNMGFDILANGRPAFKPQADDVAITACTTNDGTDFFPRFREWTLIPEKDQKIPGIDGFKHCTSIPKDPSDPVRYKLGVPLNIFEYFQKDPRELHPIGFRIGAADTADRVADFPPCSNDYGVISLLDFSEATGTTTTITQSTASRSTTQITATSATVSTAYTSRTIAGSATIDQLKAGTLDWVLPTVAAGGAVAVAGGALAYKHKARK